MQIRTFWKAREQTRKTMLFFAHQPQYSVIFVGRKLGRFGVPGFCVVCLLCLSTRPWGGPPRSGASQGLGIGNIMLVMQGKPNFQRITGATCAPPRPHRPPPWLDPDPPCSLRRLRIPRGGLRNGSNLDSSVLPKGGLNRKRTPWFCGP